MECKHGRPDQQSPFNRRPCMALFIPACGYTIPVASRKPMNPEIADESPEKVSLSLVALLDVGERWQRPHVKNHADHPEERIRAETRFNRQPILLVIKRELHTAHKRSGPPAPGWVVKRNQRTFFICLPPGVMWQTEARTRCSCLLQ